MMLLLSSLSSSTPPLIIHLFRDRISSSIHATTSTTATFAAAASLRRRLVCCSTTSNLKSMPDSIPLPSSLDIRTHDTLLFPQSTRLNLRSGHELLSRLKKGSEYGRLPENVASALEELYENYRNAIFSSEYPNAEEIFLSNMSAMLDCVIFDMEDPFIFPPYHKAVREPYDYYAFGQNYIRPLIDFRSSYVGNIAIFREMEEKRQQVFDFMCSVHLHISFSLATPVNRESFVFFNYLSSPPSII